MIANLDSFNLLDLLETSAPGLPEFKTKSPGNFGRQLQEAIASNKRQNPLPTAHSRNPVAARPAGAFIPIRARNRLPEPTRAESQRAGSAQESAAGPGADPSPGAGSTTQTTDRADPGQTMTPMVGNPGSDQVSQKPVGDEATTENDPTTLSLLAQQIQEDLAKIIQMWQEAKPDEKAALLEDLQKNPMLAGLLDVLSQGTGQPVAQMLQDHPLEEVLEPIQKILSILQNPEAPSPEQLSEKLNEAAKDNPLWKDLHPGKAIKAFAQMMQTARDLKASESPVTSQNDALAQSVQEPGGLERYLGILKKLAHKAENQETVEGTKDPADQSRETGSRPKETRPETVQTKKETAQAATAKADRAEGSKPGTGPINPANPSMGAGSETPVMEGALSETPTTAKASVKSGQEANPTALPKGARPIGNPQANQHQSGSWNFSPSDRTPEKASSPQNRPTDPVRGALFAQIIEKAEMFKVGSQKRVMTLQLNPESLGKLNLELTSKDGSVSARITTEHALVREKLEQIVPQIKEHLSAQGINLGQVTVDISQHQPDGRKEEFSRGKGGPISSILNKNDEEAPTVMDVRPALRRMALNIRMVDLTV